MAVIEKGYSVPGSGGELASALYRFYRERESKVAVQDIIAWSYCGELYLAHLLCDYPLGRMRSEQYSVKEWHGGIVLDCSDYDRLYAILAGCQDAVGVCLHLPDENGTLHEAWVERQLIYDMLDFCRDGIG